MRWGTAVACGGLLVLGACDPGRNREGEQAPRAGLVEVHRIDLEELPGDPVVRVESVGMRPGGGFVVADRIAGRVRLFDEAGRQVDVIGRPGEGPGELDEPAAAVELSDGRLFVVQRASPTLTVYAPDRSAEVSAVPGHYGFWAARAGTGFVAGVATRETRFATFDDSGRALAVFGARDELVNTTPFWIFFARDHAAVLGDVLAANTSFYARVTLFDLGGDSIDGFDVTPDDWVAPTPPPVSNASAPGNRVRIEAWSRSFTVVRGLAAVSDSLLVVEYGRHDPQDHDAYYVAPTTASVYDATGERLAEGLTLPGPVVGGGPELLVLVSEPPGPWTLAAFDWR